MKFDAKVIGTVVAALGAVIAGGAFSKSKKGNENATNENATNETATTEATTTTETTTETESSTEVTVE